MKRIRNAIQELVELENIHLETPEIAEHGDYATNVAMVMAKEDGKNPRELAEEIVQKLQEDNELSRVVAKIEVAGPGFINFWLSE